MNFFYQSGALGFDGNGYKWHKFFNYTFPNFPVITKTLTLQPKKGHMYFVIPFFKSVWNRVGLDNPGLNYWVNNFYKEDLILSINIGPYMDMSKILREIYQLKLSGIELNVSCPNVSHIHNIYNTSEYYLQNLAYLKRDGFISKIYLKVNYKQDLSRFRRLHLVDMITLNSIPFLGGGGSGKVAQKNNWAFIDKWQGKPYIPTIAGSSWTSFEDIKQLENKGCTHVGIGSIMLTNPKLVERLEDYGNFK